MDITAVEFEGTLIIVKNNQQIVITPFQTQEPGTIKLGITAPKRICIDREEIYILKQKNKSSNSVAS